MWSPGLYYLTFFSKPAGKTIEPKSTNRCNGSGNQEGNATHVRICRDPCPSTPPEFMRAGDSDISVGQQFALSEPGSCYPPPGRTMLVHSHEVLEEDKPTGLCSPVPVGLVQKRLIQLPLAHAQGAVGQDEECNGKSCVGASAHHQLTLRHV